MSGAVALDGSGSGLGCHLACAGGRRGNVIPGAKLTGGAVNLSTKCRVVPRLHTSIAVGCMRAGDSGQTDAKTGGTSGVVTVFLGVPQGIDLGSLRRR